MNYQEFESINWRPYWQRFALPLLIIVVVLVLLTQLFREEANPYPTAPLENRTPYQYKGSFNRDFRDLNDVQLAMAKRIGVEPAATREILAGRVKLQDITNSEHYVIDDLTHSAPLLIPEAHQLLNEIGYNFRARLEQDTLPLYVPIVTSVTRTDEDVKKLRKGNGNASENSTHQYGTTFDISWKRYHKVDPNDPRTLPAEELKHLLAIVLRELHLADRCYIVHERKQACFHITVRK